MFEVSNFLTIFYLLFCYKYIKYTSRLTLKKKSYHIIFLNSFLEVQQIDNLAKMSNNIHKIMHLSKYIMIIGQLPL